MSKVVIIGGGFSGTMTAVNLVRFASAPMEISIINNRCVPCRGIAYSTQSAGHLLNVAARNMSALADQPNHFLEWLTTRSEYVGEPVSVLRDIFVPRKIYGDYLHGLYHHHATTVAPQKDLEVEWVSGEATDVSREGSRALVSLADGHKILADKVVLAIGNQTPAPLRLRGLDPQSPKYINNPWQGWEHRLPRGDQNLLLIGTGLTTLDVLVTLQELGWKGKIYASSRSGLLPLSHFHGHEYPELFPNHSDTLSLREMFALFKRHYKNARAQGINPAILVDKLRPHTQRLWQNFSVAEKRRFNRHLRSRWNSTRHRIAPALHRQLHGAIASGQVHLVNGRISECVESRDSVQIKISHKKGHHHSIEVGAVINCTGPRESYTTGDSILVNNLVARGLAVPDEMNMGIKAGHDFDVLDRKGASGRILFAMGSILKGTLWESLAVPELRSQAFRVAKTIAEQLTPAQPEAVPITEAVEDVIEYSI